MRRQRPIEAELLAQLGDVRLRCHVAKNRARGIAWDEMNEREDQRCDAEQHWYCQQEAPREVRQHAAIMQRRLLGPALPYNLTP